MGDCFLYFGCRKEKEDFIYINEQKQAEKDGIITKLVVAFSRETDKKIYVQHKLYEDSDIVWKVISSGGYFYVCGDAKYMAKDVEKTLLKIIEEKGKKNGRLFSLLWM